MSPRREHCHLCEHIEDVRSREPEAIFGPDIGADERIMDGVKRRKLGRHVCGLSNDEGGFGIDANGATAQGVHAGIRVCIEQMKMEDRVRTVAIQGWGAVGAHIGNLLYSDGFKIVAASNMRGTMMSAEGLPVAELFSAWQDGGDDNVIECARQHDRIEVSNNLNDLFKCQADLFVPSARTMVVVDEQELSKVRREENPDAVVAQSLMKKTMKPRLIAEAANAPISDCAATILEGAGVIVLPDIAINGIGADLCWRDWIARKEGTRLGKREDAVREGCERIGAVLTELGYEPGMRKRAEDLASEWARTNRPSICDCEIEIRSPQSGLIADR